jgi:membrane-associated protein
MTLQELLDWIKQYDQWVYGLLLMYSIGKTGPLPMVAGYAAALGALRVELLLGITVLASVSGAQLRFLAGRRLSPWLCKKIPRVAPWLALASAGVERYSAATLSLYRFVKGAFSIVGIGAGASLIPWRRHLLLDTSGALLWAIVTIGIGYSLGLLGAAFDPRWSAYVGLSLLAASLLFFAIAGRQIKQRLLPLAEKILAARTGKAQPLGDSSALQQVTP